MSHCLAGADKMNEAKKVRDTSNRYTMAYAPITNVTNVWLQALIDDATKDLQSCRNDIFSIAVYSFAEGVVNYRNVRGNVLADARKLGLKLIGEYMDCTDLMVDELEKLLLLFNMEEHMFLNFMRHQNVHGKWSMAKDEPRKVHVPENGKLAQCKFDNDAYQEVGRRFVESDHHKVVSEMRDRFSSHKTPYWVIDNMFRLQALENIIIDDIIRNDGRRFHLPDELGPMSLYEFKERAYANQKAPGPAQ